MSAIAMLSKVPWGKIAAYGPAIIETAGKLLDGIKNHLRKKGEPVLDRDQAEVSLAAFADRIAVLESNEVRQAELVSNIAQQLGALSNALQVVSQRATLAFFLSVFALVASLILIALVLIRQ